MKVIINADDFGLNHRCTNAICEAFHKGFVTDTTWMVNSDAFEYAVEKIRTDQLEDRMGIHFNLTEGQPLTERIKTLPVFTLNGEFHGRINRTKPLSVGERQAAYEELSAQIERIEDAGITVTHADSHHHIHTGVFVAPIVAKVCQEHGIHRIRLHRNIGAIPTHKRIVKKAYNTWLCVQGFTTTRFFGSMEDVDAHGLKDSLEIMVHPDYDERGRLIDRTHEDDGKAVGKPLVLPLGDFQLSCYKEP